MIPVKATQDDASHWYLIPNDEVKEFDELMDKIYSNEDDYEVIDEFTEKFSKYMTGGGLNNFQLYVDEKEFEKQ